MTVNQNLPGHVAEGQCFSSNGVICIKNEKIEYSIDAQEYLFLNDNHEKEASFFATTIRRTNIDAVKRDSRPVVFVYEGGPGAASAEMFLGFWGIHTFPAPNYNQISAVPPFNLQINDDVLLDMCDIVLVDPVGTGYARLYDENCCKKYLGVEADAFASRKMISFWLSKYGRWNSPKYVCGKSYGGMRAAIYPYYFLGGSIDPELGQYGLALNGTIILCDSNVGDFQNMTNPRISAPNQHPAINLIATFAAINHYHHPEGKPDIRTFLDEAHRFAYEEYAHALLIGEDITGKENKNIIEKLSYFTGMRRDVFESNGIAVDVMTFSSMLLREEHKAVSLYDGRFTREACKFNSNLYDTSSDDPLLISLWTKEVSLINKYMSETLGVDWDREYNVQNYNVGWNWDFTMAKPAEINELLGIAANRNPSMKIFIGKGIYDCVTPIGDGRYTLSHYQLPKDRITYKEYESGHAIWLGKTAKKALSDDLREFIRISK